MKILFCASEAVPFAKTGGLADVVGALPLALEKEGQEVAISLPAYPSIKEAGQIISKLKKDVSFAIFGKNIKVYFIENDKYFKREGLYGDKAGDYSDNLDRFSYYSKRTLELLKKINFKPDIIHCHDWQAALIPVYLKSIFKDDSFYKEIKTVFTIHNIGYQGIFPKEEFSKIGIDWSYYNMEMLEFYGRLNLLKGGLVFSDFITTVSDTYSKEIQTEELGFGMEGILSKRSKSVFGIINGLDYNIWNPQNDPYIKVKFSLKNIQDKSLNKEDLQKACNLALKKNIPLLGIVSRLAEQKGVDILLEALEDILNMDLELIILGTGDQKYHKILEKITKKYPGKFSLNLKFDDSLAHKIYAGCDVFIMPSKYEPCGLGQLISLKYGTVPLVYKTGGLADTVNQKNGFVFDKYTKDELVKTVVKTAGFFKDQKKWTVLVKSAMACNFSWEESAKKYIKIYENK